MGGKKQFPYMVDPNTGTSMYESDDIISYLFDTYGEGSKVKQKEPWLFLPLLGKTVAVQKLVAVEGFTGTWWNAVRYAVPAESIASALKLKCSSTDLRHTEGS